MLAIKRYPGNPILGPNPDLPWGQHEARNPGVVFDGKKFHLLFTATPEPRNGKSISAMPPAVTGFISNALRNRCCAHPRTRMISTTPAWKMRGSPNWTASFTLLMQPVLSTC